MSPASEKARCMKCSNCCSYPPQPCLLIEEQVFETVIGAGLSEDTMRDVKVQLKQRTFEVVKPRDESTLWKPKRLDIACGANKTAGFTGIDIAGDAEIKHDLFSFPWPIRSNCVKEIFCSHFVEHIPHEHAGWDKDGWWLFFEEVHRIMKRGAIATFVHPYVMSGRAFWDPTHVRFIHEMHYYYLNAEWRKANKLEHYPITTDFDIVTIDGLGIPNEVITRSPDQQMYMRVHYWNIVQDLKVILKKK